MTFDIVMVSYNSEKYIEKCINSILNSTYDLKCVGIYVYDNSSSDRSLEILNNLKKKHCDKFKNFIVVSGNKNNGFGWANNKIAHLTTADYLFFLNIDCEIFGDTLLKISQKIEENPSAGIYELKQQKFEHPKYYDPISGETDWASGACMIMNRKLFMKLKGFDKNIFMYCEDVELSFRVRRNGYKIIYLYDVPIIHYSYTEPYEFKRSQYVNSVVNNVYLRFKYGSLKDIIKGIGLYHLYYKEIDENKQISADQLISIKAEVKRNKRIMFFKGFLEYLKRIRYIFAKRVKFLFKGFDYGGVKDGPFYQVLETSKKPLVSIIVRTCNRPEVLRETLISIKKQTYQNIEIVVVEDGGDSSKKVVEEFSDMNINYYPFMKKVGRCVVGNKGLELAKGKYLNFLDDDDLFYPDHVATLVSELENSDAKVAYASAFATPIIINSLSPYNYEVKDCFVSVSTGFNNLKLLYSNITPIQCVMFEKEVYNDCGGFDLDLDALEDWELWLRYSLKYEFKFVKRTTSIYRIPADNKLSSKRAEFLEKYLDIVREKYKDVKVSVSMDDLLDYNAYFSYISADPWGVRFSKLMKLIRRNKK